MRINQTSTSKYFSYSHWNYRHFISTESPYNCWTEKPHGPRGQIWIFTFFETYLAYYGSTQIYLLLLQLVSHHTLDPGTIHCNSLPKTSYIIQEDKNLHQFLCFVSNPLQFSIFLQKIMGRRSKWNNNNDLHNSG